MSLQGMQQEATLNVLSLEVISYLFHELQCINSDHRRLFTYVLY